MTFRFRPWGPSRDSVPRSQAGGKEGDSQLGKAAPGGARSEWRARITSSVLGIPLPHTPADCRGLGSAASPFHPTRESGHLHFTPDPQQQEAGTDGGGGSTPGHAREVPIASSLRPPPPARLDRRKAFLWEPPGCHVTLPAANPPPPLSPAPPLSCSGPARAPCVPRAPSPNRAPGGLGGGAEAEGWLQAKEEAAPASAQAQKRASRGCRRRPRAEEGSESNRAGLAKEEAPRRGD